MKKHNLTLEELYRGMVVWVMLFVLSPLALLLPQLLLFLFLETMLILEKNPGGKYGKDNVGF